MVREVWRARFSLHIDLATTLGLLLVMLFYIVSLTGAWCFVRPGERLLPMNEQLPVFPYTWQYCAIQSCAEMNNETTAECQETEVPSCPPPFPFC